jgi:PAS domain S-box-containing protein
MPEKVLLVCTSSPAKVRRAIERFPNDPVFVDYQLDLLCKGGELADYQNWPVVRQLLPFPKRTDYLSAFRFWLRMIRERYAVVVVLWSLDPGRGLSKLFALLLNGRRILIFNENLDCAFLSLRFMKLFLRARAQAGAFDGNKLGRALFSPLKHGIRGIVRTLLFPIRLLNLVASTVTLFFSRDFESTNTAPGVGLTAQRRPMREHLRQNLPEYLIAIGTTAFAALTCLGLNRWFSGDAWLLPFVLAVLAAAWFGGLLPGLLATFLSVLASFFVRPDGSNIEGTGNPVQVILFMFVGMTISVMNETRRKNHRRLETGRQHLEQEVARGQEELAKLDGLTVELQRKVRELQTLIEVAPLPVAVAEDAECRRVWVNQAFTRMLQLPPGTNTLAFPPSGEEPPFRIFRSGQEVPPSQWPMQSSAAAGVPVLDVELDLVRADGEIFTLITDAVPLLNEQGQVRGCLAVCFDITARKRSEAQLREREKQLQLITDHVSVLIAHVDSASRYAFVNKHYAASFGSHPKDIIGRSVSEVVGEEAFARIKPYADKALSGQHVECEVEIPFRDLGSQLMWCGYDPEFDAAGKVVGYVATGLNLTERRLAEKALRSHQEGLKETDKLILAVGPILQHFMWANKETRAKIQRFGANILPINFYSNTPSIEEIESSYEYTTTEPPYLNPSVFAQETLQRTLEQLLQFEPEFNPPLEGDEENCRQFFWKNSQFSYSDAMAYYCFLRLLRPSTIVEIGSGFSTLVALEAVTANRGGLIHCIEPFPRPFLRDNDRIILHTAKAQDLLPEFLNDTLQDNDALFIDSTHTVKTGSDCLHIYLRLLPKIRRNIFIHVHDVFLPFGLPQEWLLTRQIFWTEQYLLLALLMDNPNASVLYGSNYNATWNPSLMEKFMGGKYPFGGSSLWFKYNGVSNGKASPHHQ